VFHKKKEYFLKIYEIQEICSVEIVIKHKIGAFQECYLFLTGIQPLYVEIDYIWGVRTPQIFGISRYSTEIQKRIPEAVFNNISYPWVSNSRIDQILKRIYFPMEVFRQSAGERIKHISSQGYAYTAPYLRKGPVVLTCHDLIPWTFHKNRGSFWKANIRSIQRIEHIIAISEYTKKELVYHLGIPEGRVQVIPNGVDNQKFHPVTDPVKPAYLHPEDKVLLYAGSEETRKNLAVVLSALKELIRGMQGVKLIKAGGPGIGISQEACINEVNRLGLARHVIFTGTISDEELLKLYNIADAFVFPSLYEGFGLPPLEAMACGCPVIASDRTSIPEVVGDAGILLDPEDPEAWCNAMFRVLDEPATRKTMKQRSLQRAKAFTWETCAHKTQELYRKIEGTR
jgi:glycosyltransferase involved in cell wall biosynthesis